MQPGLASPQIRLIDNPQIPNNNWKSPTAEELYMEWAPLNLTSELGARVDISLWGYWEDTDDHQFVRVCKSPLPYVLDLRFLFLYYIFQVGYLAKNHENSGKYTFNPRTLMDTEMLLDSWKKFTFGVVQVAISNRDNVGLVY